MCRFLPPLGRHQKWCQNLRYLVFFEICKLIEKDKNMKILKSYRMCRFLPPPGRQQNRTANLRYLVFFEIRKNFEKDAKNKVIKIILDVSLFAASGTATKSDRESPLPCVFWNSLKNWKRLKKYEMLKSYRMCRFLLPPGRQQNRTGNLRYLVFFEIRKKIEKDGKNKKIKII